MNKRWLWITLGVIALFVVLFGGAIIGAGLTYLALQANPVKAAQDIFVGTIITEDNEAGLLVIHVEKDSPAAEAGIVRGDIILAVDGNEVNTDVDLLENLEDKSAGDDVILTVQHCETTEEFTVQLEERNGHVYLGIQPGRTRILEMQPFRRGVTALPIENPTFVITRVVPDSTADDAGLNPGDVIIAVDGEEIQPDDDLANIIHAREPGDEITLSLQKPGDDDSRQITVTLGENPDVDDQAYLGVEYMSMPPFTEDALEGGQFFHFEIPDTQGERFQFPQLPEQIMPFMHDFPEMPEGLEQAVVIRSVTPGSPADEAGLEPGDLITEMDGEEVSDPNSFAKAISNLEPGDEITLTVFRDEEEEPLKIKVVLGENPDVDGQTYLGVSIAGFFRFEHSHDEENPFHFEFEFPWQGEKWPPRPVDPLPGEET